MTVVVRKKFTTPPQGGNLTTVNRVKLYWGMNTTEDDEFLAMILPMACGAVESFCNRKFGFQQMNELVYPERDPYPYQVPGGLDKLMTSVWPVVEVVEVKEYTTVLEIDTDFVVDYEAGLLSRIGPTKMPVPWQSWPLEVTYTGGYALPGQTVPSGVETLPANIEWAVLKLLWGMYVERRRDPFVTMETVEGVGQTKYYVPPNDAGALPPDVTDLLDNYRVPVVR